jgi:outer membrane protein assembly factor BamB
MHFGQQPAPMPGAGGVRVAMMALPACIAVVIGLVVAVSAGRGPSRTGSGPGAGGVTPPGERLQWDSNTRPSLVVTDINGDGIEDFVGRYRLLDLSSAQSTQTEFVGAFDGKTFKRIWASAPMGTLEQASSSTFVGVAADRVLVTDFRAQAHVLDLKTGKELRVFTLSDRAKSVCSPAERRSEVWIEVADNKHVVFNLATGTAAPGPKPAWCSPRDGTSCEGHGFSGDACGATSEESSALYKLGLSPDMILRGDGRAIAVATKTPGTPVRLLAAFDPRTMTLAWQQAVAPDPALATSSSFTPATLAGGRVFTTYKTTTPAELHVTALDAATGKRVLDFKVPRGNEGSEARDIIVSAQRIYVPHWTWLDIFDARDGRAIETVGMW